MRYYYKAVDGNGVVVFDHQSDSAARLLALRDRSKFTRDGWCRGSWWKAKVSTNIPDETLARWTMGDHDWVRRKG